MMQVAPPPPPGLDPTFLFDQLMPIVGVIVLFVGLRWVFRTPVGDAIAERIRAGIHRRRHWKGFGGEWVDAPGEELSAHRRVAVLEEQVSTLQGQLSELAERVEFAERMPAERRVRDGAAAPVGVAAPQGAVMGAFFRTLHLRPSQHSTLISSSHNPS